MKLKAHKSIGKRLACAALSLLPAVFCLSPVLAAPAEKTPAERIQEPATTGWLVGMKPDRPVPLSLDGPDGGLEYVTETVCRTESREVAEQLLESGFAEYVEPDGIVQLAPPVPSAVPKDQEPLPVEQLPEISWNYTRMQTEEARTLGLTGKGVRIGIIDSGLFRENANLQGATLLEGWDYTEARLDETGKEIPQAPGERWGHANVVADGVGHGTNVAQTIVGRGSNKAAKGIAPEAEIVPLRCFDNGGGTTYGYLAAAIEDAVKVYHCNVINMSWGLSKDVQTLRNAIQAATDAGVVLLAASGNVSAQFPQRTVLYPAAYPGVIGVGGLGYDGSIGWYSICSSVVDVTAPGLNIPYLVGTGTVPDQQSGTSFACPAAAAAAAQILQLSPDLSPEGVEAALENRAVSATPGQRNDTFGWGEIQAGSLYGSTYLHMAPGGALEGWFRSTGGGTVLAASYSPEGRMESCASSASERTDIGLQPISLMLPKATESGVRLFFADAAGAPLGDPVNYGGTPVIPSVVEESRG